jgi:hypothetical protein
MDGGLRKAVERPDQTRRPPISRRREKPVAQREVGAERKTEEGKDEGWE